MSRSQPAKWLVAVTLSCCGSESRVEGLLSDQLLCSWARHWSWFLHWCVKTDSYCESTQSGQKRCINETIYTATVQFLNLWINGSTSSQWGFFLPRLLSKQLNRVNKIAFFRQNCWLNTLVTDHYQSSWVNGCLVSHSGISKVLSPCR